MPFKEPYPAGPVHYPGRVTEEKRTQDVGIQLRGIHPRAMRRLGHRVTQSNSSNQVEGKEIPGVAKANKCDA